MAVTNHERVGKAMDLLKQGLAPFVDREFKNSYKDKAAAEATRFIGEDRLLANKSVGDWDTAALLKLMWEAWNDVFRHTLGRAERTLLSELRATTATSGRTRNHSPATTATGHSTRRDDS